jgi:hypothetical protein
MESQDDEERLYLRTEYDIHRRQDKEQQSIGQEKDTKHLGDVIIFFAVKQAIDTGYRHIADKGADKSYKEQDQWQQRIGSREFSSLLSERCGKHTSGKGHYDE